MLPLRTLVVCVAAGAALAVPAAAQAAPELRTSASADRSGSEPLDGRTVAGKIHVFAVPESGRQARFWLDNPGMAGTPRQTENSAPWDFAGGNSNGTAKPFDTATVSDGPHSITVAVTGTDGSVSVTTASFTVANGASPPPPPPPSEHTLLVSDAPDRSAARALEGATLSGNAYVFAKPDSGTGARFWLDDPDRVRSPRTIENNAPWDFVGGNSNGTAKPFDTRTIPDGAHTITVVVALSEGGSAVVHGRFNVANHTTAPALAFDRASTGFAVQPGGSAAPQAVTLNTVAGPSTAFAVSENAGWLSVSPATGSTPAALTLAVDASGLPAGTYTANVDATAPGYTAARLVVMLSITQPAAPDQVHLAWTEDPSTTMTVVWNTGEATTPSAMQYRAAGTTDWQTASGALRSSGTSGQLHETTARGLAPSTAYEYRVIGDGGRWSDTFRFRTAPPPGPADFDAVYFGDTGLIGRADGLATGTEQIRDLIAGMDPLVVLGGGDYAYYNTDTRFGSLENTIDAWFDQSQPFAARSALMTTYGNHEVFLGEGYANWAARFATPAGFDGRRTYSFDVGDAHFISVFAASDLNGGLRSGTESWIEADVAAARARGQRWIVPFFHVAPFADGSSHPSNLDLRADMGPLFERLGVKVALSTHDQSYERTFPLTGVPAINMPTTSAKRCYTLADGVTWMKVSPAGKLSSKNKDFSRFQTFPAPAYTAVRDDTMHHFTRLRFTRGGTLRVEVFGVRGDGSPPIVQDSFEYRDGACEPELQLSRTAVALSAGEGGTASSTVDVTSSLGAAAFSASDDAPWLEVTPAAGSTPGTLTLSAGAAGLAPGAHDATVTVEAPGHLSVNLTVRLTVTEDRRLLVSSSSSRTTPKALEGSVLSGVVYAFLAPAEGATRVRFWLDDPGMTRTPKTTEGSPPWDFIGTLASGAAKPFDTRTVASGRHTITAVADLAGGGTETVHASFDVVR